MSSAVGDHGNVRMEPPRTLYDGYVELPGYGDAPNRCRPLNPVGFCEGGHTILGRSSCQTRSCPDHWRDWVEKAVVSIVERLAAYREAQDGAEKRLVHAVASPPQDRTYSKRALWATRSDAYEALEAAGVRGGASIVHPWRTNERGDGLFETAVETGAIEEGTGKWAFLRDATDDQEELGRYIEAAPHYHALAAAEDVDGSRAPEGWVVENIRSLKRFHKWDSESYRDMARTAYYLLTHTGVQRGRQATTYFGDIHPAAFDPEEELTAATWNRIQDEARRAVKVDPEEEAEGIGDHGPEECPRDDCDCQVLPLEQLGEFLDRASGELLVERDGRERWLRLRGTHLFVQGLTDRPPPSIRSDRERFLNWLEVQGGTGAPEPQQTALPT